MKAVALGIPRSTFAGVTPLFAQCAAPEAIAACIAEVTAKRDHLNRQLEQLHALTAKRAAQVEAGEWP